MSRAAESLRRQPRRVTSPSKQLVDSKGQGDQYLAFEDAISRNKSIAESTDSCLSITSTATPEITASVSFTTTKNLFDAIYDVSMANFDYFIVSGVTPAIFREICHEREQQMRKFRMSLFDPDTEILYITVPSQPHETMHSELYQEIMDLFVHGNLRHSWKVTQSTRYDGEGQKPGATSAGEGDSGGKPRDKRPDARDWPTLVIEAGYSSTLPTMRQKMQWWFNASKYKVKIVILVYFSSTRLRGGELDILTLEKWVAHGQQRRPGASNTRAFPGVAPALVHTNQVTYSGPALTAANYTDIPLSQFQVSRGDLILEFCQLMLREPQAGSGEGDFVITVTALQRWARSVWEDLASLSGNFALLNLPTIEQRPLF